MDLLWYVPRHLLTADLSLSAFEGSSLHPWVSTAFDRLGLG